MGKAETPAIVNKSVKGILIPASPDLQDHGISHLLLDDHRGIYLIHSSKKSARMAALNRTRVEIQGLLLKTPAGEHPHLYVNSYSSADNYLSPLFLQA